MTIDCFALTQSIYQFRCYEFVDDEFSPPPIFVCFCMLFTVIHVQSYAHPRARTRATYQI